MLFIHKTRKPREIATDELEKNTVAIISRVHVTWGGAVA
jgi:hypothetical protein